MTTEQLINKITYAVVNPLIALMFAGAILVFMWGLIKFIKNADNETEREIGQKHMLWGIIGLAIMLSAVAIVNVIKGLFGV